MSEAERDAELADEQRYLDRVYTRLEQLRGQAAENERAGYRIASVGNFGAYVERDAMVYHAARRRRTLDSEHEGLVFGRLDLGPDARSGVDAAAVQPAVPDGETRYIGRLGLRDERYESLVVDWRAPAAAPFYRATQTEPMGVVRRRTIRSSGETVIGIEDDLLDAAGAPAGMPVIGDGALLASLARTTGPGMRDIVSTIQREQDEAIRSPASGVTVVRGGPGTGKTAVALHRAAYLLYADRNRFEKGGVLVVGPSEVFVSYVSRVLPSLGEDTVTLRSLGNIVVGLNSERHDPVEVAAVKGSLRMVKILSRAAHDYAPDSPDRFRLLYRGTLLEVTRAALNEIRTTVLNTGLPRNTARPKAAGLVLDALWRRSVDQLPKPAHQPRGEFAREIAQQGEFTRFMNAWWPRLRPLDVLGWLGDRRRLQRYSSGILSGAEVELLARTYRELAGTGPTVADIALLDELGELLGDPKPKRRAPQDPFLVAGGGGVREVTTYSDRMAAANAPAERPEDYRDYAHVVVDESQDVSPMQWRSIGRRGQYASWTIVGDPAQAAWADPAATERAMDTALGRRRRNSYRLSTNYRNTVEIFDVAARVIRQAEPQVELPTAVRSDGVEPQHRLVAPQELLDAAREAAEILLKEVDGTVGVITAMASVDPVAAHLAGIAHLADLGPDRLQVVGSLRAKGMEYDGVVVVEPAAIRAEGRHGARTLYVALSRATLRLTTVSTDRSWLPD